MNYIVKVIWEKIINELMLRLFVVPLVIIIIQPILIDAWEIMTSAKRILSYDVKKFNSKLSYAQKGKKYENCFKLQYTVYLMNTYKFMSHVFSFNSAISATKHVKYTNIYIQYRNVHPF